MSFTALQELTANEMNQRLALIATKTADETVNNSATFQNDDHLFLAVEANTTYLCWLHLIFNSGTTPDLKTQFTGPSGATFSNWTFLLPGTPPAANMGICSSSAGVTGIACDGNNQAGDFWGLLVVSSTAGTFQLQWAQNTANASNTILRSGSFLIARKVG